MQRVACRALGFRGFECSVFSVQYSGFGIRRVPRQFVVQRCLSMCATGRRTSPNFTEPRTGVPRSDRAHPPLVRQQHSCPADRARSAAFGFTIHDSHSLPPRLGKRNTESGKRRSHSRFTIHIHIPPRASAGGRQVAFGVTIHDSHSHPPTSVGRWSAALPSGSRFTIHIHIHIPPRASAGGRQVCSRRSSHSKSCFTSGFIRVSSPRARRLSTWSRLSGRVRWFSDRRLMERSGVRLRPRCRPGPTSRPPRESRKRTRRCAGDWARRMANR